MLQIAMYAKREENREHIKAFYVEHFKVFLSFRFAPVGGKRKSSKPKKSLEKQFRWKQAQ